MPLCKCALAKRVHGGGDFGREVALRHLRVLVALATQIAANVAVILAQQRVRIVFRMTLQKDKQALTWLDEEIGTRKRRVREDLIAGGAECKLRQIVQA